MFGILLRSKTDTSYVFTCEYGMHVLLCCCSCKFVCITILLLVKVCDHLIMIKTKSKNLQYQFDSNKAAMESILYSYRNGFSGFAAALTESQAKTIAGVSMVANCKLLFLIRHSFCLQAPVVYVLLSHNTMQVSQKLPV